MDDIVILPINRLETTVSTWVPNDGSVPPLSIGDLHCIVSIYDGDKRYLVQKLIFKDTFPGPMLLWGGLFPHYQLFEAGAIAWEPHPFRRDELVTMATKRPLVFNCTWRMTADLAEAARFIGEGVSTAFTEAFAMTMEPIGECLGQPRRLAVSFSADEFSWRGTPTPMNPMTYSELRKGMLEKGGNPDAVLAWIIIGRGASMRREYAYVGVIGPLTDVMVRWAKATSVDGSITHTASRLVEYLE